MGYYQACERLDENALAPVGEKVAGKVRETFKNAIALVVGFPFIARHPLPNKVICTGRWGEIRNRHRCIDRMLLPLLFSSRLEQTFSAIYIIPSVVVAAVFR